MEQGGFFMMVITYKNLINIGHAVLFGEHYHGLRLILFKKWLTNAAQKEVVIAAMS